MSRPTCGTCPFSSDERYGEDGRENPKGELISCAALAPFFRALSSDRSYRYRRSTIGCMLHPDWTEYLDNRVDKEHP